MKINSLLLPLLLFFASACCDDDDEKKDPILYELEINIVPELSGRIEVLDAVNFSEIERLDSIVDGTKVVLRAIPNEGYKFSGFWLNNVRLNSVEPEITMTENNSVKAAFLSDNGTPVEVFGKLGVKDSNIVDSNGIPVQLRGMSFFWSQWIGKYWNADVVNWLALDWEVNIVRAAMGVDESGGYIFNRTEKSKVEAVVDAAIDNGIYILIDWHSHHAENYADEAVEFFSEMAKKYGAYPNVIYEIYNEPLDISWNNTLKPYAEKVIAAIRAEDPDNLILVGTPKWCQNVDDVIGNEIEGINIAYTFHFYASEASHHQALFTKATNAINAGIPLFVSEWGVSEASGDGLFNKTWTQEWIQFMDDNKLSWCNWSVADKAETSSVLLPGANAKGGWSNPELSESGRYIRELLRSHKGFSTPE